MIANKNHQVFCEVQQVYQQNWKTYDAFTVRRSGKDLENLDCVASFVLYLCSGAGPSALFEMEVEKVKFKTSILSSW